MKIQENVPFSSLTTMRVGGAARYVLDIENRDEVRGAYTFAREKDLPVYVLGRGANTLAHDDGFRGVILRNKILGIEILAQRADGDLKYDEFSDDPVDAEVLDTFNLLQDGETVWRAYGGETWDDFAVYVSEQGYTGVETLAAIPGTVGAAPVQNIGAYGSDLSRTIFGVEVFDTLDGEYKTLFPDELDLGYRRSIFNTTAFGRYFIVAVLFRLHKGSIADDPDFPIYNSLKAYLDEHAITDLSPINIASAVTAVRDSKLPDPDEIPSAGSFFKNVYLSDEEADAAEKKGIPVWRSDSENKINTGWLVEHSGLMGKDLHGFRINEKAALVLINDHASKYADLAAAREEIRDAVREKFGFEIEQEPVEIIND